MTAGTAPPARGHDEARALREASESESFVDKRLQQTRRQVKSVDLWGGLVLLATATLAYLLIAALADHWLIPGGLGFFGRAALFVVLVIAGGAYVALRLAPVALGRVNPVFAAQSIEQCRPTLKNSLINLIYLRRERPRLEEDRLARGMYQSLERKAAAELGEIPPDVAVDRSQLIRLGYVLAAVLAAGSLYLIVSPKSTLMSFHRVLWPWADLPAPTWVTIEDVEPGDRAVYQGEVVEVSAAVDGLGRDEPVTLYYSTADGRSVDQAVPMPLPEGGSRHQAALPPGRFGLQQDVEYYLAAGDCRTRKFHLEMETALSILVDRVAYDYPDYTGIPDRVDHRVADLRAIEGTRVTIRATASREIREAAVEPDCDPRRAVRMKLDTAKSGEARLTLMMDPSDPGRPECEAYQVRCTDTSGRESHRPTRHRIEVIRDLAPEIRFVRPPADEIELPLDDVLELRIRAVDPDFALRKVALRAERDERSLAIAPLLDRKRPEPAHEGPFQTAYRFEPLELGLEPGDKVIYWAEAEDNMHWEEDRLPDLGRSAQTRFARRPPNRSETARRWITITPPEGRRPPGERPTQKPEVKPGEPPTEAQDDAAQPPEADPRATPPGEKPNDDPSDQGAQREPEAREQQADAPADQEPSERESDAQSSDSGGQPPSPDSAEGSRQDESDQQAKDQQSSSQEGPGEKGAGQEGPGEGGVGQEGAGQEGSAQEQSGQQGSGGPGSQSQGAGPGTSGQSDGQGGGPTSPKGAGQRPSAEPGQGPKQPSAGQPDDGPMSRSEPVDGQTNPGDAFQRILDHLQQTGQNAEPSGQTPTSADRPVEGEGSRPPDGQPGAKPEAPGESADRPSGDSSTSGDGTQAERRAQSKPDGAQPSHGEAGKQGGTDAPEQRTPDNAPSATEAASPEQKPGAGKGAQAKGPGEPIDDEPSGQGQEKPDARGGDPQQTKGEGGAGKPTEDDAGTPSPQEANRQRDKPRGEGEQAEPSSSDAQSPSTSPKDSDSEGETGGDRSGGGEQGGGQKSDQSGTGSGGTHTASEQGGSQSDQQGEGPTGPRAGDQVEADGRTGSSADEGEGRGSSQQARGDGQSAQDSGQGPSGTSQHEGPGAQRPPEPGPQVQTSRKGKGAAHVQGSGGVPGGDQDDAAAPAPEDYRREDPNYEYAQQKTNLALEYLEEQLGEDDPDQRLLDRLGWTKEDLKRFHQQWKEMKRRADRSEAGRRELHRALDSLGLRPGGTASAAGRTANDSQRGLREGLRIDPPPAWAETYRAYKKGVAGHGR